MGYVPDVANEHRPALLAAALAAILSAGCPEPESEPDIEWARPERGTVLAPAQAPPSLAEEALARCEAMGDAYAESLAQLEAAVEGLRATDAAGREAVDQDPRLVELRAQSKEAFEESQRAERAYDAVWDAAFGEEADRWNRERGIASGRVHYGQVSDMTLPRPDVQAAAARRDAAKQAYGAVSDAYFQRLNDQRAMIEGEIASLRERVASLEQRTRLDKEQLGWAIGEANALREPGGPICTWQFE